MKFRYEIDLTATVDRPSPSAVEPVAVTADMLHELAVLMLDAYRNTIDFDDETIEDAVAEVGSYFEDSPMLDHSFAYLDGDRLASAVLVRTVAGGPFVSYVMTAADRKGQGMGTALVAHSMATLRGAGHERLTFYITDGNVASETLFANLGARRVDEE